MARHAVTLERPDLHDPLHRVRQEQTEPGQRGHRRSHFLNLRKLHNPSAGNPGKDAQIRRGRAEAVAVPPKQVPRGPLGDLALCRNEQSEIAEGTAWNLFWWDGD